MKKLLISTALVASMGFVGAAFAQTVTPILDAAGNPIYTWENASGVVVQGTYKAYQDALTALSGSGAISTTGTGADQRWSFNGTSYTTEAAAMAAQDAAEVVFAQSLVALTEGQNNSLEGQQESLLQSLLSNAKEIQVSLANTSENLANIDGSISIDLSRFEEEFDVTAGTNGVTIMEPLNATIGELTTTVIGSLGDGSVISTSVLSNVEDVNQAMTQTSDALNLQFGTAQDNLGLQQVYNLSSNLGALDASVDVVMAGVNLDELAGVATTAIGSLGTGAITANVTNNAAGLTERLIGTN